MGQPSNSRYQTVWWLARRTDVTFGLPEQVCEALAIDDLDVEASPSCGGSRVGAVGRGHGCRCARLKQRANC